jgi:hypothetical protein
MQLSTTSPRLSSCVWLFFVSHVCDFKLVSGLNVHQSPPPATVGRRTVLHHVATAAPLLFALADKAAAVIPTGPNDGALMDLPPEAVRSYLQYRIPLQTAADFYTFELPTLLKDPANYGEINELFQFRGQGNPSRMEREFTNTFRIVGLSMPPDVSDAMRDAQFQFERGIGVIQKTTAGIRRNLPIELDANIVETAMTGWEQGRVGMNEFFAALNAVTGMNEMKLIPAVGPNQFAEYKRSERRYMDLKKKLKLCANRGGPTLSAAWGQLMVRTFG